MGPGFDELELFKAITGVNELLDVTWYTNGFFNGDVRDILNIYPLWDWGNLTMNKLADDCITSGWINTLFWVIVNMKLSFGHLLGNPKPEIAILPP